MRGFAAAVCAGALIVIVGDGRFAHSSSGSGRVTVTPMAHRYYAPRYLGARRF